MLRSLREVQSDDTVVGFYQASPLGAFFKQTMVETQVVHQEKLRQGGVVILHGTVYLLACCLAISPPFPSLTILCRSFASYIRRCFPQGL
jgi:hypothetical protein